MRLIDADKLNIYTATHQELVMAIEEAPTVDAVPLVRGEWKYDRNKDRIYCNCCKKLAPLKWDEVAFEVSELISDFCPNCGADMRGEK